MGDFINYTVHYKLNLKACSPFKTTKFILANT